ncbi:MAG: excinuclease subunit, partial [Solirubrobacteraceae bacterium]|nr:excinuclease subunit [Solirubrobacteraceae bacterium]
MPEFRLDPIFTPAADQPRAIDEASEALAAAGNQNVTLLGATGTGKTMTMAGIIERLQRPTLVMAHNKTL